MMELAKLPNTMMQKVEANGWDSRAKSMWKSTDDADLSDFLPTYWCWTEEYDFGHISAQIGK